MATKRITGPRATVKQCEPVELSDNNNTPLVMELTIPNDIHLNSEAPSRYQILSGKWHARWCQCVYVDVA